jgi:predicted methyltransferase
MYDRISNCFQYKRASVFDDQDRRRFAMRALGVGLAIAAALFFAGSVAGAANTQKETIAAALYDLDRPFAQQQADERRKPEDVLLFSGVKPGSKVLDFMPGDGYWTRLLSRIAGSEGHVYAFATFIGPPFWSTAALNEAKVAGKETSDNPLEPLQPIRETTSYKNITVTMQGLLMYGGNVGLPEQVDVAVSINDYSFLYGSHDYCGKPDFAKFDGTESKNAKPLNVVNINKAIFRTLKPGGYYVVADYVAAEGMTIKQTSALHRVDVDRVKKDILAAGFVLDSESNTLANSADDHTMSASDISNYGRSDQFLLRFKKPLDTPRDKRHPDSALKNYFGNTFHIGPNPPLRIMFHPDHRYQEYEDEPAALTSGYWYADADGHICCLHEATGPAPGFTSCHPLWPDEIDKKPGDHWIQHDSINQPWQASLEKGIVLPDAPKNPDAKPIHGGVE